MVAYFVYPMKNAMRAFTQEGIENPRLKTEQEAIEEALKRSSVSEHAFAVCVAQVVSHNPFKYEKKVKHIAYRGTVYSPEKIDVV